MKLEKMDGPKFAALTKPAMALVLGGSEATGGGTQGFTAPHFKYTSDCIQRNSKGQIYYVEYVKEDGTIWEHCAEGVSQD